MSLVKILLRFALFANDIFGSVRKNLSKFDASNGLEKYQEFSEFFKKNSMFKNVLMMNEVKINAKFIFWKYRKTQFKKPWKCEVNSKSNDQK